MKSENKATKKSHEAQTEEVNNPEVCQHPPSVQYVNEQLTDQTTTGHILRGNGTIWTTGYQPHTEETPAKPKK